MRVQTNAKLVRAGFVIVVCLAFCGAALAQAAQNYYNAPRIASHPHPHDELPIQVQQQQFYNYSGTVGRMGLGADPYHPEGPGNFSSAPR